VTTTNAGFEMLGFYQEELRSLGENSTGTAFPLQIIT
jgi:hypothetical protein